MANTLLDLITDVCAELSLDTPASIVGSSDQAARTLLRFADREGRSIIQEHNWTFLTRLHSFTTVNGQATYALPSDYSRLVVDTEWDESQKTPLIGPLDGIDWRVLKSSGIGSGVVGRRFRIFRDTGSTSRLIYIDPTPGTNGDTLSFEYVSNAFCTSATGTLQNTWQADTDTLLVDADLFRLGVQVRYRRARGLAFTSEADEYRILLGTLIGQDRPSRTLNLNQRNIVPRYIDLDNVPETGYGS